MPARGEQESRDVVYYRQVEGQAPALDFLDGCPIKLQELCAQANPSDRVTPASVVGIAHSLE